jgi:hypothetical protein
MGKNNEKRANMKTKLLHWSKHLPIRGKILFSKGGKYAFGTLIYTPEHGNLQYSTIHC